MKYKIVIFMLKSDAVNVLAPKFKLVIKKE